MKRFSILFLYLIVSCIILAQEFQVGDLYYKVTSNSTPYTAEVVKMSKKSRATTLDIPEQVDYNGITYTVTSLGEEAFKKSKFLVSITIPNNVEIIGNNCFEESKKLKEVNLPNSLTIIGWSAFSGCTSLTTIIIPNSVMSLGMFAFSRCYSLKSITLSENLSELSHMTFFACSSLKTIVIPNGVTELGYWVFKACPLKNIQYQGTPQQWQQIKKDEEWYDGKFNLSYLPVPNRVQSVQQPLLAQEEKVIEELMRKYFKLEESDNPTVEKTPVSAVTPAPSPQTIIQPEVSISAVDKNIPQTHIRNENTFVVIIANENYEQVASVPYAINDGKIFRQYCEQTLGIPSENIKLHTDATFNHTRLALSWLKNVCEVYNGEASVIFYYAGHGIPDVKDNSSYLLPTDGDGRYVATAYKLDELYNTLGSMPAKSVVVFMDACFSGANRNGQMLASERAVAYKSRPGLPKGNMVVFSAAQADETALPNDAEQHGMFTYYLLKKLQETEGNITLQKLGEYIIDGVRKKSVVNGKLQTPCVTPSATLDASWREWKLK